MNIAPLPRLLLAVCCGFALLHAGASHAYAVKFTGNAGTAWSNGANWEGGQAPIGGGTAEIIDRLVDLDVPVSVSGVTMSNGTIRGAGGSLTVTGQLQIASGGFFSGPPTTVNIPSSGTVKWSGGSFTSNFTLNNSGVIELSGPVAFEGTLNNSAAGSFVMVGDHGFGHTQRVGVINNAGRIVKQAGNGVSQFSGFTAQTNQINTTVNNTGTVEVASGTLEIGSGTSPGSFVIAAGKTLLVQGNGPHTFDGATFTGAGKWSIASSATLLGQINSNVELELLGTLIGGNTQVPQASLAGPGQLTWRSGAINGAFTISEGVYALLTGPAAKSYDGTPVNKGTIEWAGPGPLVTNKSTFRNEGTFNVLAAGTFLADIGSNGQTFANVGTLNTFPGGTSQTDDTTIVNSGTVNIGGVGSTGILRLGRVFVQEPTGTLNMEVGGANAATPQFDQLQEGFVTIDGTLTVEIINGYAPPKDARFVLINVQSQSGKFARVSTPGGASRFAVEYSSSRTDLVSLSDGLVLPQLWVAGRDLVANELPDRSSDAAAVNQKVPQWSYGFRSTISNTGLTLFTSAQHQNGLNHPAVDGWTAGAGVSVAVNTGTSSVTIGNSSPLRPEQLLMLPTPSEFAVARWTAPEAGTFNIAARWVDADPNGGNGAAGYVVVNGQQIFGGQDGESKLYTGARWPDGGKVAMAPRSLQLAAGDVVDFVVGSNGDSGQDLTAVNAVIRRAPAVTIAAPGTVVAGQEVTVSVNLSAGVSGVALRKDGMNVGTDREAPFEFVLRDLTPGIYHLQAEAVADEVLGASNVLTLKVTDAPVAQSARRGKALTTGSTYTAITSGTWDREDIWRRETDNANGVPGPDDVAIIPDSVQIILDGNRTVKKLFSEGRLAGEDGNRSRELTVTGQLSTSGSVRDMTVIIPVGSVLSNVRSSAFFDNITVLNEGDMVVTQSLFASGSSVTSTGKLTLLTPPASGGPVILQGNDISLKGLASIAPGTAIAAGLVGLDAGTLVGQDGGSLVGQDGGSLVGQDGSTLVGQDGGSLVGQDGGSLVGQDGGSLVGQDGGSLVGQDGGSLVGNDGASVAQINAAALVQRAGSGVQKFAQASKGTSSEHFAAVTGNGLVLTNGGTLAGNCNVIGDLTNDGGFVMPGNSAGSIVVAGDYVQTATGGLVVEAGGTQAGQFDLLKVLDTATLGGKLIVKTINGVAGASITPLTYGAVSGGFDSVSPNAQVSFGANGMSTEVNGANPPAPKALNIATRMRVETGDNVLIAGFIISGSEPKRVLVRGIGPSLPVEGALADPTLDLDAGTFFNDDWRSDQQGEIEGTTIPPSSDLESAIVATLEPGAHTAVLRGKNNGTGVGLVEVYDLETGSPVQLANISTRGQVQTGDNVMIGGFIIAGDYPAKVLLRAIGPSLPIAGALQNPTLELVDGQGNTISNDNWRATQEAEIVATTVPPTNDREAAIVATLAPGAYTAVVRGKDDTVGVALVEGYNLE